MANQINNGGLVRSAEDYLALDQTVPQNTNADGNGGAREISNALGALEVVAEVGSVALGLADTKVLTVKLQSSNDNGVGDAFADLVTVYTKTASGAEVVAAGTELGRYIVPTGAERYIKPNIVSTDAAGTGKVNVFLNYLPR
jgi:hypothetical protein